ncbi:MAG: DNA polymerase domain-containing protein [Candidatus Bathyarchaeia archaeon]|jgi:DNA polymerase I
MVSEGQTAWLVNVSYKTGQVTLRLITSPDLEAIEWVDRDFQPYYLTTHQQGEPVKKVELFTGNELRLTKVNLRGKPARAANAWELDIDPAMSYAYDKGLRFGLLHHFNGNGWVADAPLNEDLSSRFEELFGAVQRRDPLKYASLKELYAYISQPVPRISEEKLRLAEVGSEDDYFNAFLLSRIANLPLNRTHRNYSVSDWIRSMLNSYYRTHNILIPNPEELKLGDTRKMVTGALAIAPEPGTYFNMHVLDFESLYPGCIDVFNLSYETVQCAHPECQKNLVPGQPNIHVCTKRRGIYSALVGALRDLRLQHYKPQISGASTGGNVLAASEVLKLFLVSCYGVTIRIHGLASPLLGEAITAYGRHVLQSTWDLAENMGLRPKYGDTDSVFLDNPTVEATGKLIQEVSGKFRLPLAYDRVYSVCVLSTIKAYFGILPNGEPEIKGLAIAKSNSPRFFQQTFQRCLTQLSEGRRSPSDFETAKGQVPEIVIEAVRNLRERAVPLADLEYRVELREDPHEKLMSKRLPQPYQAAWLLMKQGKAPARGETIEFVKVLPFRLQGRQFTVKPTSQVNPKEIDVDDYTLSLYASLSQAFDPMNIKLGTNPTSLSDFI